jgi:hypothetical protein
MDNLEFEKRRISRELLSLRKEVKEGYFLGMAEGRDDGDEDADTVLRHESFEEGDIVLYHPNTSRAARGFGIIHSVTEKCVWVKNKEDGKICRRNKTSVVKRKN